MTATASTAPLTVTGGLQAAQLLAALKWLRGGRSVDFVAAALQVDADQVNASVAAQGWPDADRVDAVIADLDHGRPIGTTQPVARHARVEGLTLLPVADLQPSPANPRERLTDIVELADSIHEVGLIQPIIVQQRVGGAFEIVAGHRRWRAVRRLGWSEVEVIVRREFRPDAELATMLIENGQRANLDPIEEARALNRLKVQLGCSDATLAKRVGYSQPKVSGRLALLALSVEEQEAVRAGQTTLIEATHTARVTSGKVRAGGDSRGWHLGPSHALALLAKARCKRLGHKGGRVVGGMACGECWESVIRADDRQHQHQTAARSGQCPICNGPYGTAPSDHHSEETHR